MDWQALSSLTQFTTQTVLGAAWTLAGECSFLLGGCKAARHQIAKACPETNQTLPAVVFRNRNRWAHRQQQWPCELCARLRGKANVGTYVHTESITVDSLVVACVWVHIWRTFYGS